MQFLEFCRAHGLEYVVLKRVPHAGLPALPAVALVPLAFCQSQMRGSAASEPCGAHAGE